MHENSKMNTNDELDGLDASILRFLERNGRATNYEVGEAVGLSASAASRRIQALESAGAIRGYRAEVDDRLLGKRMTIYIRVTLERQSASVLGAFEAAVRHCNEIVSCHLMAGQYDYMLVARVGESMTTDGCIRTSFRGCLGLRGWKRVLRFET